MVAYFCCQYLTFLNLEGSILREGGTWMLFDDIDYRGNFIQDRAMNSTTVKSVRLMAAQIV